MKKIHTFYTTHTQNCFMAAGFFLSCLFMVPYILLGGGSIITYHDQLDGELLSYLLTAKYLFTDTRVYPEIMNGLPATGAVPPAPLFVLFYVIFKPLTAFLLSQWCIYILGFLGMYLLLRRLTGRQFISFSIAVIFMLLPFYPVYGLCIPGQPLLLYAVLELMESKTGGYSAMDTLQGNPRHGVLQQNKFFTVKNINCYLLIILYGTASSLVLVGFACLLLLGSFALYQSILAIRTKKTFPHSLWLSLGTLLATYIFTNLGLLKQVLFPETSYVSHKTEMVLSPQDAPEAFQEVFLNGISYAQSYHAILFLLAAICLLLFLFQSFRRKKETRSESQKSLFLKALYQKSLFQKSLFLKAAGTGLFILAVCVFHVFYHSSLVTELRNASGGILKTFNLDRICWLLPTAWCILAGYLLSFISEPGHNAKSGYAAKSAYPMKSDHFDKAIYNAESDYIAGTIQNAELSARKKASGLTRNFSRNLLIFLSHAFILCILCTWGITVLLHSSLRPNLSKLLKGEDYYALDWNNFFAEDIFSQIKTAIGRPQDDYHVVSIGIYPAAATYNGFYCLDGYSNNYPLVYKHTFRQIMEGELAKNDYVRDFFDNWGNRCYITTAEQANYYTFEKKWNSVIYNLDLNTDKLKEMDCQYIFSAAYIMNAEEMGLSLLQDAPFETDKSWYHIYVYSFSAPPQ